MADSARPKELCVEQRHNSFGLFRVGVGLSNKLDRVGKKSVNGREPIERTHRPLVGASVVNRELMGKIGE